MSLSNSSTLPGALSSLDTSSEGLNFAMLWHDMVWSRKKMSTQKLSFPMADLVTQVGKQVLLAVGDKTGLQFCTLLLTTSCSTLWVCCCCCSPQRCCWQWNDLKDVSMNLHSNLIISRWTKKLRWPISTVSNFCIFLIMFYIFLYPLFSYGRIPFFLSTYVLSQC